MLLFDYFLPILGKQIETDTTLLAIITPYAAQVRILNELFEKILKNKPESEKKRIRNLVEINTVDSFQGKQADIVLISLVRTEGSHNDDLGFLIDQRRINVLLSRARFCQFIFG